MNLLARLLSHNSIPPAPNGQARPVRIFQVQILDGAEPAPPGDGPLKKAQDDVMQARQRMADASRRAEEAPASRGQRFDMAEHNALMSAARRKSGTTSGYLAGLSSEERGALMQLAQLRNCLQKPGELVKSNLVRRQNLAKWLGGRKNLPP